MKKQITIYSVGGYNYVGKNMTIVDFGNNAVVFDAGLNMEQYVKLTEDQGLSGIRKKLSEKLMIKYDVIPDLKKIKHVLPKVSAIIITHGHLDHVGGLPFMIHHFKNATVLLTPYTAEILRQMNEETTNRKIRIKKIVPNSSIKIDGLNVEFIYITHSIPQTVVAKVTYDNFTIVYANDFKLDPKPILGGKVNYNALTGIKPDVLIVDSTRIEELGKTGSESLVEPMIREIVDLPNLKNKGIIATTFASHIARLKVLEKIGKSLGRKVFFMGRSMGKYIKAAERVNIVKFDSEIIPFKIKIKKILNKIDQNPEQYFIVTTGHQGEPGSVLREIATGNIKLDLTKYFVIFSCSKIPTPTALSNREFLENKLNEYHVPFFTDAHVSGHASKEDLRTFIEIIKPKLVIPAHGGIEKRSKLALLCKDLGVKSILMNDIDHITIDVE